MCLGMCNLKICAPHVYENKVFSWRLARKELESFLAGYESGLGDGRGEGGVPGLLFCGHFSFFP
jgi:hypothetical protein